MTRVLWWLAVVVVVLGVAAWCVAYWPPSGRAVEAYVRGARWLPFAGVAAGVAVIAAAGARLTSRGARRRA